MSVIFQFYVNSIPKYQKSREFHLKGKKRGRKKKLSFNLVIIPTNVARKEAGMRATLG